MNKLKNIIGDQRTLVEMSKKCIEGLAKVKGLPVVERSITAQIIECQRGLMAKAEEVLTLLGEHYELEAVLAGRRAGVDALDQEGAP